MCGYPSPSITAARGSHRCWRAVLVPALVLLLVCVQTVKAQTPSAYANCDLRVTHPFYAHVISTFEPDAKQYDMLTDWIDMPHSPSWECTFYTNHDPYTARPIEHTVRADVQPDLQASYMFEGDDYTIFGAGLGAEDHIALLVKRRYHIDADNGYSWDSDWVPINSSNLAYHNHLLKHEFALPHNTRYTISIESRARLLKWGATASESPTPGHRNQIGVAGWYLMTPSYGAQIPGSPPIQPPNTVGHRFSTAIMAWFNRSDKTCSTPSTAKTVYLPTVSTTDFTGINSSAGTIPFNLELFNCSSSVAGIEFKLTPAPFHTIGHQPTILGIYDEDGIMPRGRLRNTGTASGVTVQVLDDKGDPVNLDVVKTLKVSDYTPGAPTASIPLQAQYIRVPGPISAGTVRAMMKVLYMYK